MPDRPELMSAEPVSAEPFSAEPIALDEARFRDSMALVAASVSVVCTVDATGRPHGLTVSSLCSLSMHPPLVLICLQRGSSTVRALCESERFAVSVLGRGQVAMARRFAAHSGDRFSTGNGGNEGILSPEAIGAPVLEGALAWLQCRRHRLMEAGDHTILIGLVEEAVTHPGRPLVYYDRDYRTLRG
jgi:flavin reductase ActVB